MAKFATISLDDAAWRAWAEGALRTCMGVIIDVTNLTPGLTWELERARQLVDPRRIVILHPEGAPPPAGTAYGSIVAYDPSRPAASTSQLEAWVRWLRDDHCTGESSKAGAAMLERGRERLKLPSRP